MLVINWDKIKRAFTHVVLTARGDCCLGEIIYPSIHFQRYDHNKNDKILPISLEPSSSTEPAQSNLR